MPARARVNVGIDMEMAMADPAYAHLPEAVEAGAVSEAALDACVRRVLEAKLRLGLFDAPVRRRGPRPRGARRPGAPRGGPGRRRAVGGAAAQRGRPAAAGRRRPCGSIAVIGPLADSRRDTLGPWVFDFDLDETVTVLDGIRSQGRRRRARSSYAPGVRPAQRTFASMFDMFGGNAPEDPDGLRRRGRARSAPSTWPADADVAVVVVGEWQNMIGEAASRSSLELPGRQLELLQAVVATGTPVVLLVMNGRPLDLRWAAEHVPAILDIWYPGTQGGAAVANLLFGDVSPGGKLPFTWPRTVGQVPMIYSPHHAPTSRRTRGGATGTRRAPRCSRSATA